MDALMLEGWTPILLCGIMFAIGMYIISRKVSRKALILTATVLSLICIGLIIFSKDVVGGWDGIFLAYFTITIFVGVWIGTFIGAISKR
ncbi:sodium:dicarboxylate symporter [Lysinibacillus sp. 2017]|uniref:YesK family protein n=1 Tax=unclassified Lysinibacillus TaxID=2636778 RepID=UPI000D52910D|nr:MULTISPECIES: YesK family protein [unclassified Lysinibacillus]AWE08073.1 sodium:dicarboxylate symporter [Lysinibacillus sp. 2017]TGN36422.1 sodium:dicarboxylate symporter [Lysinibacillus sp. S2017]